MTPAISLRPTAEPDEPFLFELFKRVRGPEFAPAALPAAQLDMLLNLQYKAQKGAYESAYPDSQHYIVLSGDTPIGQLWVDKHAEGHHLIDIALLPEYCGQGIGSELVKQLIVDAAAAGVSLRCSVAANNTGSLRFHQRLGFRISSQDPVYYELEYPRGPANS